MRKPKHCSTCRQPGHNKRTCLSSGSPTPTPVIPSSLPAYSASDASALAVTHSPPGNGACGLTSFLSGCFGLGGPYALIAAFIPWYLSTPSATGGTPLASFVRKWRTVMESGGSIPHADWLDPEDVLSSIRPEEWAEAHPIPPFAFMQVVRNDEAGNFVWQVMALEELLPSRLATYLTDPVAVVARMESPGIICFSVPCSEPVVSDAARFLTPESVLLVSTSTEALSRHFVAVRQRQLAAACQRDPQKVKEADLEGKMEACTYCGFSTAEGRTTLFVCESCFVAVCDSCVGAAWDEWGVSPPPPRDLPFLCPDHDQDSLSLASTDPVALVGWWRTRCLSQRDPDAWAPLAHRLGLISPALPALAPPPRKISMGPRSVPLGRRQPSVEDFAFFAPYRHFSAALARSAAPAFLTHLQSLVTATAAGRESEALTAHLALSSTVCRKAGRRTARKRRRREKLEKVVRLVYDGKLHSATEVCVDPRDALDAWDPGVQDILRRHYPLPVSGPVPPLPPIPVKTGLSQRQTLKFDGDSLEKLVGRQNLRSSPGPDGIQYAVLKKLFRVPRLGVMIREAMVELLNLFMQGRIPASMLCPVLIPLPKGEADCRPIGIFSVFVRVAAALVVSDITPMIQEAFDTQFAVGAKGGSEVASVLVREHLASAGDAFAISLDFVSAFNRVSRDSLLRLSEDPAMSPYASFVQKVYGTATPLFTPRGILPFRQTTGGCQGDPMMPALFTCVMELVYRSIPRPEGVHLVTYLDDGWVLGRGAPQLATAVQWLEKMEKVALGHGVELNGQKVCLLGRLATLDGSLWSASRPTASEIVDLESKATTILGVPFSLDPEVARSCVASVLRRRVREPLEALLELGDPHVSVALLRSCVLPRLTYLWRTVPPSLGLGLFTEIHDVARAAVTRLLSLASPGMAPPLDLSPFLPFPVKMGGLGLRYPAPHSPPAFLANFIPALPALQVLGTGGPLAAEAYALSPLLFGKSLPDLIRHISTAFGRSGPPPADAPLQPLTTKPLATEPRLLYDLLQRQHRSCPQLDQTPARPLNKVDSYNGTQRYLSAPVVNACFDATLQCVIGGAPAGSEGLVRGWLAQQSDLATRWKMAAPTPLTHLEPATYRAAVQAAFRSHSGWTADSTFTCSMCGELFLVKGGAACDHPLTCVKQGKSHLHSHVQFILEEMVRKAGQEYKHEPPLDALGVPLPPNVDVRKDAVKADWSVYLEGRLFAFDVTIPHSSFGQDAKSRVAAAEQAKMNKYRRAKGLLEFRPVVCSLVGLQGKSMQEYFALVQKQARANGRELNSPFYQLRVSAALAADVGRRWAEAVFSRTPEARRSAAHREERRNLPLYCGRSRQAQRGH
jgi:Reverse transcriptase (RNA-dependent DNA polymerase)